MKLEIILYYFVVLNNLMIIKMLEFEETKFVVVYFFANIGSNKWLISQTYKKFTFVYKIYYCTTHQNHMIYVIVFHGFVLFYLNSVIMIFLNMYYYRHGVFHVFDFKFLFYTFYQ